MLVNLKVSNFAIVDELDTDWHNGMTAITGETGAGKSIAIDALSLCLGSRADVAAVRPNADKADISALFDITHLKSAQDFLAEHMLENEQQECLLRRVISHTGRSKSYINGVSVTTAQLKELGQHLLAIHGQHAHQLLVKPAHQLALLDGYTGKGKLLSQVKAAYQQYQQLIKEQNTLQTQQAQHQAQQQLLAYQVAELDEFSPQDGEFFQLEQEHNKLSNSQSLLDGCQQALHSLYENDEQTVLAQLQHNANQFAQLAQLDSQLQNIADTLAGCCIQIEDASQEIRHYHANTELDPARLQELDERLGQFLTLARKHQVRPDALFAHHQALSEQLRALSHNTERLEALETEISHAKQAYQAHAEALHQGRSNAAKKLSALIAKSMHALAMENGQFAINVSFCAHSAPSPTGLDEVEFLVSTNPGQPLQALSKVASGGELSRISLAIEVIIAQKVTTPTLIFDEVDVGISGSTATSVGKLLRTLGNSTQVICVTHLPQVASCAHQQFFVEKTVKNTQTFTYMKLLDQTSRNEEIARLLAGNNISQTSLANAKELLATASSES